MSEADRTRRIDPGVLSDDARRRFEAVALPHLEYLYRLAVRLKGSAQEPRTSSRRPTRKPCGRFRASGTSAPCEAGSARS